MRSTHKFSIREKMNGKKTTNPHSHKRDRISRVEWDEDEKERTNTNKSNSITNKNWTNFHIECVCRCARALFDPFSIWASKASKKHGHRRIYLWVRSSFSLFHCLLSRYHLICRFEFRIQVRCFIEAEKNQRAIALSTRFLSSSSNEIVRERKITIVFHFRIARVEFSLQLFGKI